MIINLNKNNSLFLHRTLKKNLFIFSTISESKIYAPCNYLYSVQPSHSSVHLVIGNVCFYIQILSNFNNFCCDFMLIYVQTFKSSVQRYTFRIEHIMMMMSTVIQWGFFGKDDAYKIYTHRINDYYSIESFSSLLMRALGSSNRNFLHVLTETDFIWR